MSNSFDNKSLEQFMNFKMHMSNLVYNLCNSCIVVSPSICNNYMSMWRKILSSYKEADYNKKELSKELLILHNIEIDLISKMIGLRVIENGNKFADEN